MATTGIVHIGVGNFHRAHQAWYLERLADPAWAVCGIGMLEGDRAGRDQLAAQGFAYELRLMSADGTVDSSRITVLQDYLLAPDDPWAAVRRLADPATKIVTLTVTEGGWNTDDATGRFDVTHPAVVADAAPGAAPTTTFALVVHALRLRRNTGTVPFTVLSCDNIENNGAVAKEAFTAFARLLDPALADWVAAEVAFPGSMVDRITPVTAGPDKTVVTAEPFAQWVVEDRFTDGRPALETVNVQLVADVRPYELMKLRLLNASHQAMAYVGLLLGYEAVADAAADPLVAELLIRYMVGEATPTLEPVPGVDLTGYRRTLVERFANPEIADTLARLAAFASDRIPKFLLPVVIALGGDAPLSAAVVASWLHWTEVTTAPVVDNRGRRAPETVLADPDVLGPLVGDATFQAQVREALATFRAVDPRQALAQLLSDASA